MKKNVQQDSSKERGSTCVSGQHDWELFDSFPGYEIFDCRRCKLRKFVDEKTGKETYEQAV